MVCLNEIFDPRTPRTVNGSQVRDPFPNNTIPQSRLSPQALNLLKFLPNPNASDPSGGPLRPAGELRKAPRDAKAKAAEIAGVREKLLVLGLTAEDIADLEKERQPSATVVVRAPSDGTVIDRFAYEGQYVASFIGFLPASDPQLVVATMLDRPATEYGSIAAAPLFREIAAYGIARLGITPSAPLALPPHALPLP